MIHQLTMNGQDEDGIGWQEAIEIWDIGKNGSRLTRH